MRVETNRIGASVLVLGCGDAFDPDYGNTSFFYSSGPTKVLIDCGYETAGKLMQHPKIAELDAVVITHLHADHYFGLPVLLSYFSLRLERRKPLTIIAPRDSETLIRSLTTQAYPAALSKAQFEIHFLDIAEDQRFADVELRSAPMNHGLPTWAIALTSAMGGIAFSSDGRPTEEALKLFGACNYIFHECYSEAPTGQAHSSFNEILSESENQLCHVDKIHLVHIRSDERVRVAQRVAALGSAGLRFHIPKRGEIFEFF